MRSGTTLRVGILSSLNLDLLPRYMKPALEARGLSAEFYLCGFNQYRQEILREQSEFYKFAPSHVILFLEGEDLLRELARQPFDFDASQRQGLVDDRLLEVGGLVQEIHTRLRGATVILNSIIVPPLNALGMLEYNSSYSLRDAFERFNAGLRQIVRSRRGCFVVDYGALVAWHGYRDWYDERLWVLGRMRLGQAATRALAQEYAVAMCASRGMRRRCLVLDLDDTLWGGAAGTDGIEGIQLGMDGIGLAYHEFQEEILNLHKRGVVLAVNSKNNWEDAIEAIERHPAMVLRRKHFAVLKINWQDKATNMREIARELDLGLDNFVFVDNSPVEREWVASQLPEVQVVTLSQDPAMYRRRLLELEAFSALTVTDEDRERGEIYQRQALVEDLRRSSVSLESFYAGLQMKARIAPANVHTIPRIAQLTQKTNQFNLTTRRYTESDIERIAGSGDYRVYSLSLTDRFGANGLVGVALVAREEEAWRIDTLLLSCRVMGRTVETAFLAFLAARARAERARYLVGEYVETKKNAPVRDLYRSHGFRSMDDGGRWWRAEIGGTSLEAPRYIELIWEDPQASLPRAVVG